MRDFVRNCFRARTRPDWQNARRAKFPHGREKSDSNKMKSIEINWLFPLQSVNQNALRCFPPVSCYLPSAWLFGLWNAFTVSFHFTVFLTGKQPGADDQMMKAGRDEHFTGALCRAATSNVCPTWTSRSDPTNWPWTGGGGGVGLE